MAVAVADSSSRLFLRSDYSYMMNSTNNFHLNANRGGGSGMGATTKGSVSPRSNLSQGGLDNDDVNHWLYPERAVDGAASWAMNQDAANWSSFGPSMQDLLNVANNELANNDINRHPPAPLPWQHNTSAPSLDAQWHQANIQGMIPRDNKNVSASNQSTPSIRHKPTQSNLDYTTSNLLQRRLTGTMHTSQLPAMHESVASDKNQHLLDGIPDQNSEAMSSMAALLDSSSSAPDYESAWSVNPSLCSLQQGQHNGWQQQSTSPQRFNPSVLQQPQHWMQRDRVHSQQSSQDVTSPDTPSSGEISQPPSLITSSRLSLESPPSPYYDRPFQLSSDRHFKGNGEESGQEIGTAHIAKHRRAENGGKTDVYRGDPSYATLSRSSAAVDSTSKKNISKVVVNKYGDIDSVATSIQAGDGKETRHLCPHSGCDKHFSTSGHARRHSRIHASLRPFECPHPDCDATFTRRDNCSQHQKSRHRSQLTAHRLSKDH